jgi:hypothetical protein
MNADREFEALRKEQAGRVMPLIGPLLDAWEQVSGDLRSYIEEDNPQLAKSLDAINAAVEIEPPEGEGGGS